jgi:hypothetical protein
MHNWLIQISSLNLAIASQRLPLPNITHQIWFLFCCPSPACEWKLQHMLNVCNYFGLICYAGITKNLYCDCPLNCFACGRTWGWFHCDTKSLFLLTMNTRRIHIFRFVLLHSSLLRLYAVNYLFVVFCSSFSLCHSSYLRLLSRY